MMLELGIVEHPQFSGFVYFPTGREQLQAQVAFLHSIWNTSRKITANAAVCLQADGTTASYIIRNGNQTCISCLFWFMPMPDARAENCDLRMLQKQLFHL